MTRAQTINRRIRAYQSMYDITNQEMAVRMRMSLSTWNRKKGDPNLFTCGELVRLELNTKISIFEKEEVTT